MSFFKRLFLGESVKTLGKASFKSLRENEPTPEEHIIEKGTYLFSSIDIYLPRDDFDTPFSKNYDFAFTSNGTNYSQIRFSFEEVKSGFYTYMYYGNTLVFTEQADGDGVWENEAYKTVVVNENQTVPKELFDWWNLCTTAKRKISFTIDGASYEAYDGMTWKDWVDSEFNTNNYYKSGSFICYFIAGLGSYKVQDSLGEYVLYSDLIISEYIYALVLTDTCCFVAGTPVLMADGSFKDIETVVVGDEVLTFNEETLSYEKGVIVRTIIKENTADMARLCLSNGTTIVMNAYHPICTNSGWKSLTRHKGMPLLEVGDLALSTNGTYIEILSIERWIEEPPITTYNLDVENNDNFFVGETAIAVHNGGYSAC